jgi:hypothetical protein
MKAGAPVFLRGRQAMSDTLLLEGSVVGAALLIAVESVVLTALLDQSAVMWGSTSVSHRRQIAEQLRCVNTVASLSAGPSGCSHD